jgi:hypothetical protein
MSRCGGYVTTWHRYVDKWVISRQVEKNVGRLSR